MAEIIGIISAIGSIASAGFKISRAIAAVRDDFGAATANVKAIASDAGIVTMMLGQIRDRLTMNRNLNDETLKVLNGIVSRCEVDLDELGRALLPLLDNIKSGAAMTRRQKLRWLFAKTRICNQQAALGSLKLTLSLFIHTVQLCDGYNLEDLRAEILDAISQTKETKTTFLEAERVDHAVAEALSKDTDDPGSGRVLLLDEDQGQASESDMHSHFLPPAPANDTATRTDIEQFFRQDRSLQLLLKALDFNVIQTISDDAFLKIAAHLNLQKSVTSFALVALDTPPTGKGDASAEARSEPSSTAPIDTNGLQASDASTMSYTENLETSNTSRDPWPPRPLRAGNGSLAGYTNHPTTRPYTPGGPGSSKEPDILSDQVRRAAVSKPSQNPAKPESGDSEDSGDPVEKEFQSLPPPDLEKEKPRLRLAELQAEEEEKQAKYSKHLTGLKARIERVASAATRSRTNATRAERVEADERMRKAQTVQPKREPAFWLWT